MASRITKNSRSLDGGDVTVTGLGIANIYVDSIEYKTSQEHQLNYGLSRYPRSWSRGKKTFTCNIVIMLEDVVAIQNANKTKALVDIEPFNLIVSFLPSIDTLLPTADKLLVKFMDSGKTVTNEQGLKQSFEMFVLHIEENIPNP